MSRDQESSKRQGADGSETHADQWTESFSNGLRGMATSMSGVLANLNLVASISLLAAVVSLWFDLSGCVHRYRGCTEPRCRCPIAVDPGRTYGLRDCMVCSLWLALSTKAKLTPHLETKTALKKLVPDIESCLFFLEEAGRVETRRRHTLMRYVSERGLSLWEDMQDAGLDGPTVYSIGAALPHGHENEPDVEELHRLIKTLAPLGRKGKVEEARRIY